jgi:cytolysin-activating lysine-acyltransferase
MSDSFAQPFAALGEMMWLCAQAPNYREMRIGSVISGFQEAIAAGQYKIYRADNETPLACVCWFWFHEHHECEIVDILSRNPSEPLAMRPEWLGGDALWFFNFIAPFGHGRQVADDLRFNVFPGHDARAFRIDQQGRIRKFAHFQNRASQKTI